MTELGTATHADIDNQLDAWLAVNQMLANVRLEILAAWQDLDIDRIHVAGCGSVYFLAQTGAHLLQAATGMSCSNSPGAALLEHSEAGPVLDPSRTLLLVASRSGETSEMVKAAELFRASGGATVWCVTTRSRSTLASLADFVIAEDAGFEPSVVQTRSFSSMLAMLQGLATILAGKDLPGRKELESAGNHALAQAKELVVALEPIEHFDRVIFLASRAAYGLAQEGQLLMNEMALTDSASHHILDFRHGPISMVDDRTLVVALFDQSASVHEVAVLTDVLAFGGTVVGISTGINVSGGVNNSEVDAKNNLLALYVDPDGLGALALFMPALQSLAHRRALVGGLDPDKPRNLSAVVKLEEVS